MKLFPKQVIDSKDEPYRLVIEQNGDCVEVRLFERKTGRWAKTDTFRQISLRELIQKTKEVQELSTRELRLIKAGQRAISKKHYSAEVDRGLHAVELEKRKLSNEIARLDADLRKSITTATTEMLRAKGG